MNFPVNDFHFLRPEWFVALLPLILLLILLRRYRRTQSGWQSVIPPHLYSHLISGKAVATRQTSLSLLAWGWLLGVIALAGPSWERLPQPVFQVQEGSVVVIDMSLSMRATDVSPDRLTRAKYKAIDLINTIDEGEMGLVAYAGDAFTISPLTSDAANLTALLPSLSPEIMPISGSDPYTGIKQASELLSNAGYQQGSIYWITDGIDMQQTQDLQKLLRDIPFTVNVLGIGTEEGAPIRQLDGQLVKDQRGQIVIPKLRGNQLKSLAASSGGRYSKFTADESDINTLTRRQHFGNNGTETDEQTSRDGDQWVELGPWLLLLLLPFAAYTFRRGVLFSFLLIPMAMLLSAPQSAFAQTRPETPPSAPEQETSVSKWYTAPFLNADQQGLDEYQAKNYSTAANTFASSMWRGTAAYEAGNYEEALNQFSQSDSIDALYNQGNALAQLGQFDEAIARYDAVLNAEPDNADAQANKALLEELKRQQEQEKEQQQDQKNQEQQQDNADQQQSEQQEQDSQSQQQNDQQNSSDGEQSGDNTDSAQQNGDEEQQSPQQPSEDSEESDQQAAEQQDSQSEQQSEPQQQQTDDEAQQQDAQPAQAQQGELTDEEKEKMQRLDNLMKKIPDDPAFLLKRKMQLEAQQRRRQGPPSTRSDW